jgi:hypothetical protein
MNCSERITELVECVRSGALPNGELRGHLKVCEGCLERWDAEGQLNAHLRAMRLGAAALKSPESRRDALMREFDRTHRQARPHLVPRRVVPMRIVPSWAWTLAAAAAIVMAIFVGHEAGLRGRHTTSHSVQAQGDSANAVLYEASADASALSTDDFVEIPFTPPLAQGEMVRMIHAEMYPEALASMGVAVDPEWTGNMPVDMVVGEDGLPRAVRISDSN